VAAHPAASCGYSRRCRIKARAGLTGLIKDERI